MTACPQVCHGLFLKDGTAVGHVIGTQMDTEVVTDSAMNIGSNDPEGKTVGIHGVVIDPQFQGKGYGERMVKEYLQAVSKSVPGIQGFALIAHARLEPFYRKNGFISAGESKCQFGGGGWYDLVCKV